MSNAEINVPIQSDNVPRLSNGGGDFVHINKSITTSTEVITHKEEQSSGNVTVMVDGFGMLKKPLTERESTIVKRYTFFNRNRMSVQVGKNFPGFERKLISAFISPYIVKQYTYYNIYIKTLGYHIWCLCN